VVHLSFESTDIPLGSGYMRDVSHSGVGIVLQQRIEPGTVVTLRSSILLETATARHCTAIQNGFLVGCEFHNPMLAVWF
jgi:hypothetical protein